jgi:hypothetical protein
VAPPGRAIITLRMRGFRPSGANKLSQTTKKRRRLEPTASPQARSRRGDAYLPFLRDSLTVVLGCDLTVLCFTYRPVIAERPVLPEPRLLEPLPLAATGSVLHFRGFVAGLDGPHP